MNNPAKPDEFTGVLLESGRFYILFEHPTGRSIVKKRLRLRPEDVSALRKVLDAYEVLISDVDRPPNTGGRLKSPAPTRPSLQRENSARESAPRP